MINVENLSKTYGNHIALDNVSFEVEKGHIYGLLGPNGAGKSTTMNILTGYLAPTEGSVYINGFKMGEKTLEAKRSIGYLPEIPPVYPDMSVTEYLDFAASIKNVSKKQRKEEIERVIGLTGLDSVRRRLIKNLSKGYRQRVGIAQALLGSPEVIILDEPTVGLDPEQIIEIRTLIKNLRTKHTVILSSHILSEISAVCDECLIINHGKVVAFDTIENLLSNNKSDTQIITITVKSDKESAEKVFANLDFVASYEFVSENEGKSVFVINGVEERDISEDLSFALSDARILVTEMNIQKSSLEDIYLDIIRKSDEEFAQKSVDEDAKDVSDDDDNEESEESEESEDDEDEEADSDSMDDDNAKTENKLDSDEINSEEEEA